MVGKLGDGAAVQIVVPKQETSGVDKEVTVTQISGDRMATKQSEVEQNLTGEKAKKMTETLNKFLETSNTQLRFKFHDELKEYYVTVVNSKDEVIREIPSKKLMDIFAAMQDFLGILVDRKI